MAGLLYFTVFFAHGLSVGGLVLLHAAGFYVAVVLCDEAEVRLGRKDGIATPCNAMAATLLEVLNQPAAELETRSDARPGQRVSPAQAGPAG